MVKKVDGHEIIVSYRGLSAFRSNFDASRHLPQANSGQLMEIIDRGGPYYVWLTDEGDGTDLHVSRSVSVNSLEPVIGWATYKFNTRSDHIAPNWIANAIDDQTSLSDAKLINRAVMKVYSSYRFHEDLIDIDPLKSLFTPHAVNEPWRPRVPIEGTW